MIGRGWRFAELMAMTARDFMHWFREQEAAAQAEADAIRKAGKRR